jgi:hypothetical protein
VLPEGATCTIAKSAARFVRSIENVRSWFNHAAARDRIFTSLTLITGHIKTNSWGVAAISNELNMGSISLNFSLTGGEGSISASHSWQGYSPWMCNSGPRPPSCRRNQCVFIMGYKITKRHRLTPLRILSEVKVTDLKNGTSNYPKFGSGSPSGMKSVPSPEFQSSSATQHLQGHSPSTSESSTQEQMTQFDSTNASSSPDGPFFFEEIPGRDTVSIVIEIGG